MKKLIVALTLLTTALAAGVIRLALNNPHTDGLVLLILGAGVPGTWFLSSVFEEAAGRRGE